jgi:hypothetical protein
MPRIPEFSLPQVDPTAMRLPELQAPGVTPVRDFSSAGVQAMSQGLNQFADLMIKTQNHIDDARVREADGSLADFEAQQLGAFKAQKGMSAVRGYGKIIKDFDARQAELAKGLDNDVQRQMFAGAAQERSRRLTGSASEHYLKESRSADISATTKRIGVRQRDAMMVKPDSPEFEALVRGPGGLVEEIDRLGTLQEWDPDVLRDEKRKRLSEVHEFVIKRDLDEGNTKSALERLQKLSPASDIDPETYAKLSTTVRRGIKDEYEFDIFRVITEQPRPLVDNIAFLRELSKDPAKHIDADAYQRIATMLRQDHSDRKDADAQKSVEVFSSAQRFLSENPKASIKDFESLDPAGYKLLELTGKADQLQAWTLSNKRFQTDPAALRELDMLRGLPPGGAMIDSPRPPALPPGQLGPPIPGQPPVYELPIREMTQVQIRDRFEGRLNESLLDEVLKEAIDASQGGGTRSSRAGGGNVNRDLFSTLLKQTWRRLKFLDDKDKPIPEKAADIDRLEVEAIKFRDGPVIDKKTGVARPANDADMEDWFAKQSGVVGQIDPGWMSSKRDVTLYEFNGMTAEQKAEVTVEIDGKEIKPVEIPKEFVETMVDTFKADGLELPDTRQLSALYLKHSGGLTPTEVEAKRRAEEAAAEAARAQAAEAPWEYEKYLAELRQADTDRESLIAQRLSTPEGAAESGTLRGRWLSGLEANVDLVREARMKAVEYGGPIVEGPVRFVKGAFSKASEAISNMWTGAKDTALNWAFGDTEINPKYLPGGNGVINPAYLEDVRTFTLYHDVARAREDLMNIINLGGKDYDWRIEKWLEKNITAASLGIGGIKGSETIDRSPPLKRQLILLDLMEQGEDGAKVSPYLDALRKKLGITRE